MKRVLIGVLFLGACEKPATPTVDPAPKASASASASANASTSTSASAVASAMPSSMSTSTSTSVVASAVPSASASASAKAVASAARPTSARVEGNHFAIDLVAPVCEVGKPCAMSVRLQAQGDYHMNKEYPYKVTMNDVAGVEMLGKGPANVFAKPADFREEGEKAATMTVSFKPTAAPKDGKVVLSGTYKMSVCSEANCQIEQQAISLAVAVK
jgi:hypothetical protein